jgi:hypothetical protein
VKVDWADVEKYASQYGISANSSSQWSSQESASVQGGMPDMKIESNVNADGTGASSSIDFGGQKISANAGAGGAGASSSINMDGFGNQNMQYQESYNISQSGSASSQSKDFLKGEGIDFSGSAQGTIDVGDVAGYAYGYQQGGSGRVEEHYSGSGSQNISMSGGATSGPGGASASIDMNGQKISSDVSIDKDGNMNSKIDMGNGQTMDMNMDSQGNSKTDMNMGGQGGFNNNNMGGWNLSQLANVSPVPITRGAILVTLCIVITALAAAFFLVIRPQMKGAKENFRKASRAEKDSYKEKFNFLETQEVSVEQNC